jgi:hypothetical protein
MPAWTPVQISLAMAMFIATLWTVRVVAKYHGIAGVFMFIETKFYRSLAVNFTLAAAVGGLVALFFAGLVWVLGGIFALLS